MAIDAKNLAAGWQRLPECPGTPRWVAGMAAVGGQIYLIGGTTGDVANAGSYTPNSPSTSCGGAAAANGADLGYCTVVDNWRFDPATNQWSRLRDLPISSGNFIAGKSSFENQYFCLGRRLPICQGR